jgi:hypothetical protein
MIINNSKYRNKGKEKEKTSKYDIHIIVFKMRYLKENLRDKQHGPVSLLLG